MIYIQWAVMCQCPALCGQVIFELCSYRQFVMWRLFWNYPRSLFKSHLTVMNIKPRSEEPIIKPLDVTQLSCAVHRATKSIELASEFD